MKIYFIGGSPCSGKSTIAEWISKKHDLHYFKVDDHLDRYMDMAAKTGKKFCAKAASMTPEQTWMRKPAVQCEEELLIYREIFEYVLADLSKIERKNGIITEGAAYLPALAKRSNIPFERYISVTPTKEFQVEHYRKRDWVSFVLEGCSDKAKAFENWMDRDALFAEEVQRQCAELGYVSLINGGETSAKELMNEVAAHFGLE